MSGKTSKNSESGYEADLEASRPQLEAVSLSILPLYIKALLLLSFLIIVGGTATYFVLTKSKSSQNAVTTNEVESTVTISANAVNNTSNNKGGSTEEVKGLDEEVTKVVDSILTDLVAEIEGEHGEAERTAKPISWPLGGAVHNDGEAGLESGGACHGDGDTDLERGDADHDRGDADHDGGDNVEDRDADHEDEIGETVRADGQTHLEGVNAETKPFAQKQSPTGDKDTLRSVWQRADGESVASPQKDSTARVDVVSQDPQYESFQHAQPNTPDGDRQQCAAKLQYVQRSDWVPDEDRDECQVCNKAFSKKRTVFKNRRKHHCRSCGEVVCGTCTKMIGRDKFDLNGPALVPANSRVCSKCREA